VVPVQHDERDDREAGREDRPAPPDSVMVDEKRDRSRDVQDDEVQDETDPVPGPRPDQSPRRQRWRDGLHRRTERLGEDAFLSDTPENHVCPCRANAFVI
jgi:hypothetical protein